MLDGNRGSPGVTRRAVVIETEECEKEEAKKGEAAPQLQKQPRPISLPRALIIMPLLSFLKPANAPALALTHDHGYVLAVIVATVFVYVF